MTALQGELLGIIRRDRARRSRRRRFGEFLVRYITSLLGLALTSLLNGWLLMLAVGVIHDHWITALPTVGYWWACLVVYLLRGVFSVTTTAKTKDGES